MSSQSLDLNLVALFEQAEAESFASLFAESGTKPGGIEVARIGGVIARVDRSTRGSQNHISPFGVGQPATPEGLDQVLAFYRQRGVEKVSIPVSPAAQPPQLQAWLEERGLRLRRNVARLYRRPDSPPVADTNMRTIEARPGDVDQVAQLLASGFGSSLERLTIVADCIGKPGWHVFQALDGDEAAGIGLLFVWQNIGWLGYAATSPLHRRRGAQSALIASRIKAAAEMGCDWLTSETLADSPENPVSSYHNMLRNGFELMYVRPEYATEAMLD